MRRDRLLQLLFIASTVGCARSQPTVFVNLNALLPTMPPQVSPPVPQAPKPSASETVHFPGREAETIHLETDEDRIRHINEVLKKGRDDALRDLTARLRDAYQRQVRKLEAERLAALEPLRREALAGVYGKFRQIFERYADQRGPLVVRLALLAGFPDPDPDSEIAPINAPKHVRERFEESKVIRASIAALDKAYDAEITGLLDEQDQQYAAELLELRLEIERARADADQRAQEEARQQVQQQVQELDLELAGRSSLTVPARAPTNLVIPGQAALPSPPPLKSVSAAERLADERAALENDLGIWLAHKGYQRSLVPRDARDATEEFRAWRQDWRVGR